MLYDRFDFRLEFKYSSSDSTVKEYLKKKNVTLINYRTNLHGQCNQHFVYNFHMYISTNYYYHLKSFGTKWTC